MTDKTPALTVEQIIAFESRGAGSRGASTSTAIKAEFGMAGFRYRQVLVHVLGDPERLRQALELDPMTTNRVLDHYAAGFAAREQLAGRGSR